MRFRPRELFLLLGSVLILFASRALTVAPGKRAISTLFHGEM
jgi:hypothetical protein